MHLEKLFCNIFQDNGIKTTGAEKFAWSSPNEYLNIFDTDLLAHFDLYENMSYKLNKDWTISLDSAKGKVIIF